MSRCRTEVEETGSTLLWVMVFMVLLAGASSALLTLGSTDQSRVELNEESIRALELCEIGAVRSTYELSRDEDTDGDGGVGSLAGAGLSGTFDVTAQPLARRHVELTARGISEGISRRVRILVREQPTTVFSRALAGTDNVTVSGGFMADSYDSNDGTYVSQAVNSDANGTYANAFADIASNGTMQVSGSSTVVRGGASAGPGETPTVEGGPVISGGTTSLAQAIDFPAPSPADFFESFLDNENGTITPGPGINYDPVNMTLNVAGGRTLTLAPGTYFFTSLSVAGNADLEITGETTIYLTGNLTATGGSITNVTERAVDLSIIAHPYEIPIGHVPPAPLEIKLGGSASTALTVYAPAADVYVSGGSDLFGAVVGRTIDANGAMFHYDESLGFEEDLDFRPLERVAWQEIGSAPD